MKFARTLPQKFLLVWGLSILLALALVGGVFSYLLGQYHRTAADSALETSFRQIESRLHLHNENLNRHGETLARDRDVVSIANLLSGYQDKQNYQPLIFDVEKKKLLRRLAAHKNVAGHSYAAIYIIDRATNALELAVFSHAGAVTPAEGGIRSYRNGAPVLLVRRQRNRFQPIAGLPAIGVEVAPTRTPARAANAYRVAAGALVHSVTVPILRKHPNAPDEAVGVLIVAEILDDEFVRRTSQLIGHAFSIQLPGTERPNPSNPLPTIATEKLPNMFTAPGAFQTLRDEAYFIGGAAVPTLDNRRAALVVGIDKQALVSGLEAVRTSILWAVLVIAILILPLGMYFIRRNLTKPIDLLMSGVKDLSRRQTDAGIAMSSGDELAALRQAFNDMADTIRARELDLESSRDQLRLITDNLPITIIYVDADRRYRFVNKTFSEWFAKPVEQIVGRLASEFSGRQTNKLQPHINKVLKGEQTTAEETLDYPDGKTRSIRATFIPHLAADGQVLGYFALAEDLTEIVHAEAQLRQAQKMEAVGQLTGGIAHDFNNLLAVIMGNVEILGAEVADGQIPMTEEILHASSRGAQLTQRLLAFSRQQPLQPQRIDLAALVGGLSDLLTRTLGETITIETPVTDDPWTAIADLGQVENALLNLAINARDAMPDGGKLTIACDNVRLDEAYAAKNPESRAGDFVVLSVTDNGSGMSPEIQERVFEPFFTTKKIGEGSGLGLAMIYGFAKQSGGHVAIESELGHGTTVRLYLPRGVGAPETATKDKAGEIQTGQGEVVLVIEDDNNVGDVVVMMLTALNYRVIHVTAPEAAWPVLEGEEKIDLVLTDVVLPGGISGPEFIREARARNPALKVMFMSGYPAASTPGAARIDPDATLLTKPFRKAALAEAVRATLGDGASNAATP